MKYDESKIQKAIVEFLQLMKIYCAHIPNERKATPQAIMRLISLGMRPGFADLELWIPKKGVNRTELYHAMAMKKPYTGTPPTDGSLCLVDIVYIEVKAPKGKQSENQKKFQQRCFIAGIDYYVVYSVKEVQEILRRYL